MSRSAVVIGATFVIACAAVVSWIWLSSSEPAIDLADAPAAVTESVAPAADDAAADFTTNPTSSEETIEAAMPARVDVPAEIDPRSITTKRAIVRGRVVLSDGQPAVAADVRLHGWEANSERVIRHGKPVGWKDPIPELDATGSFRFEFDPPPAYQFALDVRAEGHSALAWRWGELAAGSETDVGLVTLIQGCVVEGDVVDTEGRPVSFPVRVRLETDARPSGLAGEAKDSFAMVDAATGTFRIVDAHPGAARVRAFGNDGTSIGDAAVEVTRTAVARCRIVHSGPDPARAIQLRAQCVKLHVFSVEDARQVVLSGHPDGPLDGTAALGGTAPIGGSSKFRWIDLPVGRYSLSIDDPRFLPWTKGEVRTGEVVRAALVGSCSVALTVLDPTTHRPVTPSRVRVRYVGANFGPNEFVLEDEDDGHVDGVYGGIVPGKTMLIVDADGFAPAEIELGTLEPRTTIARSVELARGATLRGRVTANGSTQGRSGVTVRLRSGRPPEPSALFMPQQLDERARDAVTDADGTFAFEGLMAGPYVLWAERTSSIATAKEAIEIPAGSAVDHDLELPASGSVRGRVAWRAEFPPTGIRVAARVPPPQDRRAPSAFETFESIGDALRPNVVAMANDGSFAFDAVPTGTIELLLGLPVPYVDFGSGSFAGEPSVLQIGSVEVVADHETVAEFDLGDRHPGFARVKLTTNGPEVAGLRVCAQSPSGVQNAQTRAAGVLDERGELVLGPLLPNTYDLRVMPGSRLWFIDFEPGVVIRAAETSTAEFPIALHRGSILLVDAQGVPLAHRSVALDRFGVTTANYESDDRGRIELELPAFIGGLFDPSSRRTNPSERSYAPFEWPSPTGERVVRWPPD